MRWNPISIFQSTHPSGVRLPTLSGCGSFHAISIHAPQWGATVHGLGVRVDLVISIHAPQWGATLNQSQAIINDYYFNPRTPVGCDSTVGSRPYPSGHFNPRTPVGCDYLRRLMRAPHRDFNPRTPVGCDLLHDMDCGHDVRISIHAPQWGATARMGIAFHNMEAPSVLKTDFIAKIHVHRSIHKFSNQKHQQTIHF